ncbi:hypothetical protein EIL50_04550 [bacterium NHP-B]|nr:hypothetical protein EIL50_04550 [bacterium NHP-B]
MYTYLRLACVSSVMALTSLAATAYAVGPGDEPGEAAHSAIVIRGQTYPALSPQEQETLRDLVAQKDFWWEGVQQGGDDIAYQTFMRETFEPTTKLMRDDLDEQEQEA